MISLPKLAKSAAIVLMCLAWVFTSGGVARVFAISPEQRGVFSNGINYFNVDDGTTADNTGPTTCDSSGTTTTTSVDDSTSASTQDREKTVYDFFISKGLTATQAAGIVGNMWYESGVDPTKIQGGGDSQTPTGTGWGLVQFTPPSKAVNAAGDASITAPIYLLSTQLNVVWAQLTGKAGGYSETQAYKDIKSATTVPEAVLAWQGNQQVGGQYFGYERPQDESGSVAERTAEAIKVYKALSGDTSTGPITNPTTPAAPVDTTPTTTCPTTTTTGPSDISAYKNPFCDVPNLGPSRIDEGVDYTGDGDICAIGDGTVIDAQAHTGWPRFSDGDGLGSFISYTLADGPAKGDAVYISENIDLKVSNGAQVKAGQVIAHMNNSGAHIETGWAVTNGEDLAAAYNVYHEGDATAYGVNFNDLMLKLGVPFSGSYDNPSQKGNPVGTLPAGWPAWN